MLSRYANKSSIASDASLLDTMMLFFKYLQSSEYVRSVAQSTRGVSLAKNGERVKKITSHSSSALSYIEQAMSGPERVAFLPMYYAMLNLIKVNILFSDKHAELARHRWHGATYNVNKKYSQDFSTEEVEIKSGGALPLFYHVVTGKPFPLSSAGRGRPIKKIIKLKDVYGFIRSVSVEYKMASGEIGDLLFVDVEKRSDDVVVKFSNEDAVPVAVSRNEVKILKKKWTTSDGGLTWVSPAKHASVPIETHIRECIETCLVFHDIGSDTITTPKRSGRLLLMQELPILILFFHMSSVVRYKPDLYSRLKDSMYWPMLASALQHSVVDMLMLCWSFVHQENMVISR